MAGLDIREGAGADTSTYLKSTALNQVMTVSLTTGSYTDYHSGSITWSLSAPDNGAAAPTLSPGSGASDQTFTPQFSGRYLAEFTAIPTTELISDESARVTLTVLYEAESPLTVDAIPAIRETDEHPDGSWANSIEKNLRLVNGLLGMRQFVRVRNVEGSPLNKGDLAIVKVAGGPPRYTDSWYTRYNTAGDSSNVGSDFPDEFSIDVEAIDHTSPNAAILPVFLVLEDIADGDIGSVLYRGVAPWDGRAELGYTITLGSAFQVNDVLSGDTSSATGKVVADDTVNDILTLTEPNSDYFQVGETVTGSLSSTEATVDTFYDAGGGDNIFVGTDNRMSSFARKGTYGRRLGFLLNNGNSDSMTAGAAAPAMLIFDGAPAIGTGPYISLADLNTPDFLPPDRGVPLFTGGDSAWLELEATKRLDIQPQLATLDNANAFMSVSQVAVDTANNYQPYIRFTAVGGTATIDAYYTFYTPDDFYEMIEATPVVVRARFSSTAASNTIRLEVFEDGSSGGNMSATTAASPNVEQAFPVVAALITPAIDGQISVKVTLSATDGNTVDLFPMTFFYERQTFVSDAP